VRAGQLPDALHWLPQTRNRITGKATRTVEESSSTEPIQCPRERGRELMPMGWGEFHRAVDATNGYLNQHMLLVMGFYLLAGFCAFCVGWYLAGKEKS
jgi:hypothetical protein